MISKQALFHTLLQQPSLTMAKRFFKFSVALLLVISLLASTAASAKKEEEEEEDPVSKDLEILKKKFDDHVAKENKENKELKSSNEQLKNEVKSLKEKVERIVEKGGPASSAVAVKNNNNKKKAGMPTSCEDLKQVGHNLEGFYTVQGKGVDKGHLEHIFCDFNKDLKKDGERRLGFAEVKSMPGGVHFMAQRNTSFTAVNSTITFEVDRLNVGKAMNIKTGVFTAPVNGTYYFSFSGMKDASGYALGLTIQLNGVQVGAAWGTNGAAYSTFNLQTTLALNENDKVTLFKGEGVIQDNNAHFTQYTGWLMWEDDVTSYSK